MIKKTVFSFSSLILLKIWQITDVIGTILAVISLMIGILIILKFSIEGVNMNKNKNKNKSIIVKPAKISIVNKWKMKRKVSVPDIKKYLVDEFNLVKGLEKENKDLYQQIDVFKKEKEQHELTLVTLDEYARRIDNRNNEIDDYKKNIKELKEKLKVLKDENHTMQINFNKTIRENEQLKKNNDKIINQMINEYKEKLIENVSNQKGHLTKELITKLIKKVNL